MWLERCIHHDGWRSGRDGRDGPGFGGTDDPSPRPTIQDVRDLPEFAPLEPGTYFIDPDADPSTPLRVVYEIPGDGWLQWFGGVKEAVEGHVAVSITTVTNVVRHGCRDHADADPPVGPTVDDLATALADVAPFRVSSPPTDVTIYGYCGKHLELTVPDVPMDGEASPEASTGTSRAGYLPRTQERSTATRVPATPRSSGSSTSKAPAS
jgi:hypothetical protein